MARPADAAGTTFALITATDRSQETAVGPIPRAFPTEQFREGSVVRSRGDIIQPVPTRTHSRIPMRSPTTWYILTPMFTVSGLLLVVGLAGAGYVHRADRAVSDALDFNLAAAQAAERLVLEIRDLR